MVSNLRMVLLTAALLASLAWGSAFAQNAGTPVAAACTTEARTMEEMVGLFTGTPVAWTPNGETVEIPTGRVASEVVQAGVTETVEQAFACLNAGEMLRFFGLLTDHAIVTGFGWLGEVIVDGSLPEEFVTPAPLGEQAQTLIAVADVRSIAPDQAAAFIVFIDPASGNPGPNLLHLRFERQEASWLIAGIVDFSAE